MSLLIICSDLRSIEIGVVVLLVLVALGLGSGLL